MRHITTSHITHMILCTNIAILQYGIARPMSSMVGGSESESLPIVESF